MKALILAAGFGSRMRPITNICPKPLIPFFGVPPLALAVARCEEAHIKNIAINTHHLGEVINDDVQHWKTTSEIFLSHEQEILGTGGALVPLLGWLGENDGLLIYNSDAVTNLNISELLYAHHKAQPWATMVLTKSHHPAKTAVWVEGGKVIQIGGEQPGSGATPHTFTGIHSLSPKFLAQFHGRSGFLDIIEFYQDALKNQQYIMSYMYDGLWFDLGTPSDFLHAHQFCLSQKALAEGLLDSLLIQEARSMFPPHDTRRLELAIQNMGASTIAAPREFMQTSTVQNIKGWAVIGHGCEFAAGCQIENSVLLPSTKISKGCAISGSVIFPNSGGIAGQLSAEGGYTDV